MSDTKFTSARQAESTKRYCDALTQEVSESWIVDALAEESEYEAQQPPAAPKLPPIHRYR